MAAEKLEDQLLKLKEQREILKGQGHKHEDNIMKENAKLQVNDSVLTSPTRDLSLKSFGPPPPHL